MFIKKKYTDQMIMASIIAGEREEDKAIEYLIKQEFGKIKKLITSRGGLEDDAEDIFQEALTVLILNVKRKVYKGESSISTYLYSICKGMWFKKFQKNVRDSDFKNNMMVNDLDEQTPEVQLVSLEHKAQINSLFGQLKDKCKEVLLFWASSYSMTEIADKLGLANSQVAMNKKNKCLKELHLLMQENTGIQQVLNELRNEKISFM